MHQDTWEIEERWGDLVWALGLASCRWPLTHPVGAEAVRGLESRRKDLQKAARVLARVSGHGGCCERRIEESVDACLLPSRWGETWPELAAFAAGSCWPVRSLWPDEEDPEIVGDALAGSLTSVCQSVLWARAQRWEQVPRRVERVPMRQLLMVGITASWVVKPSFRRHLGAEALRRSLKAAADGPELMGRLASEPPAGLERCIVEVHSWLRTGELGQPWMDDWHG